MPLKVGSTAVATVRLGSTAPASVAKGASGAWSNASVPAVVNIYVAEYSTSGSYTRLLYFVPNDGGSAITAYKEYFNGVLTTPGYSFPGESGGVAYYNDYFFADYTGQTAEVSAVNAIGEGPKGSKTVVAF